mmetsp:Transcript_31389/g.79994  ORF Transcript_31389/g.79994 Transcript_31389/m.79994 type:complete len:253 (-) Transcript_31389:1057-1815(-)
MITPRRRAQLSARSASISMSSGRSPSAIMEPQPRTTGFEPEVRNLCSLNRRPSAAKSAALTCSSSTQSPVCTSCSANSSLSTLSRMELKAKNDGRAGSIDTKLMLNSNSSLLRKAYMTGTPALISYRKPGPLACVPQTSASGPKSSSVSSADTQAPGLSRSHFSPSRRALFKQELPVYLIPVPTMPPIFSMISWQEAKTATASRPWLVHKPTMSAVVKMRIVWSHFCRRSASATIGWMSPREPLTMMATRSP